MKNTPLSVLRRASGLLQSDIAERLGKSEAWISSMETGKADLPKDALRSLASALKLPYSRVLLAALETRRQWLSEQAEAVAGRIRSARKSA